MAKDDGRAANDLSRRDLLRGGALAARVVGLTNGGFYAHFDSKESMVAELLATSFVRAREKLLDGLDNLPARSFAKAVAQRYLSRLHRDHAAAGCPAPATLSEVARSGEPARKALTSAGDRGLRQHAPA
jgi:TetR/AcrR family transcriptional repressor of nem operon